MTVLVTGASGRVGRQVVAQLAEAGVRVRAMTRRPDAFGPGDEVEVVRGDLIEPASLPLSGVRALFLFPEPRTARAVVAAAVEAGVRRIVTLSSGAVSSRLDTDYQLPVEQAVEASACEWTHLRPSEFAANTARLWGPVGSRRAGGPLAQPGLARPADPRGGHRRRRRGGVALGRAPRARVRPDRPRTDQRPRPGAGHLRRAGRGDPVRCGHRRRVAGDPHPAGRLGGSERGLPDRLRGLLPRRDPGVLGAGVGSDARPAADRRGGHRPARTYASWAVDHAADFR